MGRAVSGDPAEPKASDAFVCESKSELTVSFSDVAEESTVQLSSSGYCCFLLLVCACGTEWERGGVGVRAEVESRDNAHADARNRTYRHETGHRLVGVLARDLEDEVVGHRLDALLHRCAKLGLLILGDPGLALHAGHAHRARHHRKAGGGERE